MPFLFLIGLGVGLGAGLFAKSRSRSSALLVGVAGLGASLLDLWVHHNSLVHRSFAERLLDLPGALLLQLLASGALAYVLGLGPTSARGQPNEPQQPTSAPSGARG